METANNEIPMIQIIFILCTLFISIIVCHLFPRKWIWLGAISGFLGGFLLIFNFDNISLTSVFRCAILGFILSGSLIISGNSTYSYAKKTYEKMNKKKG